MGKKTSCWNKVSLLFVVMASSCLIVFIFIRGGYSAGILFLLLAIVSLLLLGPGPQREMFLLVFSVSTIFSVMLFFTYQYRYGVPHFLPGLDDVYFESDAKFTANNTRFYEYRPMSEIYDINLHNSPGYIYILSIIYRFGELFGGANALLAKIFNGCLLGWISVITYFILNKISNIDKSKAMKLSIFTGIFPIMLFVASHSYRDIIISLILILNLLISIKIFESEKWNYIFLNLLVSIILAVFLYELRKPQVVPLFLMTCASVYLRICKYTSGKNFLIFCTFAFFSLFTFTAIYGLNLSIVDLSYGLVFEYNESVAEKATGISSFIFNQPFLVSAFLRFFYAGITPIPIIYDLPEKNLLTLGTLVQIIYYPFVFIGLWSAFKSKLTFPVAVGFVGLFFGYFMGTFSFRHLTQLLPFGTILVSFGYYYFKPYSKVLAQVMLLLVLTYSFFLIFFEILKSN